MDVTPHAKIHHLQLAVLHEINQPKNEACQGIPELAVDLHLPLMSFPSCFVKHDICSVIYNNILLSKALIYFLLKYTLDDKVGREELYSDLPLLGVTALSCGAVARGKTR